MPRNYYEEATTEKPNGDVCLTNYSRFGTSIHNLRREGFVIETLPSKKRGLVFYYLVKAPDDTAERAQLRLVAT